MENVFPKIEKWVLKFWEKNKIFEKSIKQRKNKPLFSFFDGPPFATGKPHYGHILATTIKDTVLRYWTMKGYYVPRRVGWDCHGLPVENLIEKELEIKNKKEIEKLGIEKFNSACRASVFRCVKDFEETLKRVGRWADYKNSYATLENNYIESVWWVLKQLWDKGLVYKDYRISPYCPRCGTPLSNFELNQGYKQTKDPSIFIKFKIHSQPIGNGLAKIPTYLLVWTTTPWTLPANVALAVNPNADYILIREKKENYILAKKRKEILKEKYQIIKNFSGKNLVNLKYEPLFDYLSEQKAKDIDKAFRVLPADFVSLEEGTGIVHIAPLYGEDDFQIGKKFNLPLQHLVDETGLFKKEVRQWQGQFIKKAEPEIIKNLEEKGLLYKKEEVWHNYPFCWRCDSPLFYYAIESWYIAVTKIKKELIKNNKKIHWVPSHIKEGRFGQWLKEVKDWVFSRNRFWGAPIPIWLCQKEKSQNPNSKFQIQNQKKCDNFKIIGSIKELEKLSGKQLKDLHRPYIDEITFNCDKCGGEMKRVSEVFDCWFESGSMPYAQWHYPFENKNLVEKTFPADFIAEGLDQTRGWFYTLHVIATALTLREIGLGKNQPAFRNVIVNGLILDSQGRKLSKKLKNYPEPKEIFDSFGADALRYFLLASTSMGEDYRFSSEGVKEAWSKVVLTLFHSYLFFETYGFEKFQIPNPKFQIPNPKFQIPNPKFQIQNSKLQFKVQNLLDKWIVSRLNNLNQNLVKWMDSYELTKAARLFNDFIEEFSNWYIRRTRRRLQKPESQKEYQEACQTFYFVLLNLTKLIAPFLPFISEYLYQKLKSREEPESVHLCDYPLPNLKLVDRKLEIKMKEIRKIVSLALAKRAKEGIKVRQPIASLKIRDIKSGIRNNEELLDLIKEEVNVKKIVFDKNIKNEIQLDTNLTPELKEEGMIREIIRCIQRLRKKAGLKPENKILIQYFTEPELNKVLTKNKQIILKETNANRFDLEKKTEGLFNNEQEFTIAHQKLWLKIEKLKH